MTIGFIENRIRPTPSPSTDYYVLLYEFLSSSAARDEGIQLVSLYTGSNGSGGMGFSDEPRRVGDNSMAVFKFAQASPPFYVMIQFASGSAYGGVSYGFNSSVTASMYGNGTTAGGSDVTVTSGYAASQGGVGIAVACLADGGNPWNGTTASNGNDSKGNPVWISGSNTGSLCVWPRSNGQTGSFDLGGVGSRRHNMIGLVSHGNLVGKHTIMSVVADKTNILIATDIGNTGNSTFFYFGKYTPRPGLNPQVPYVCLATTGSGLNPPFSVRPQRFGTFSGQPEEGGVAHPSASFGVRACSVDYLRSFTQTANLHPNTMFDFPHKFDQFVYFLLLDEDPTMYGYLGTIEFFRLAFGTPPRAVSFTKNYAIFGNSAPQSLKLLIPWDGTSPAGTAGYRKGKIFSTSG